MYPVMSVSNRWGVHSPVTHLYICYIERVDVINYISKNLLIEIQRPVVVCCFISCSMMIFYFNMLPALCLWPLYRGSLSCHTCFDGFLGFCRLVWKTARLKSPFKTGTEYLGPIVYRILSSSVTLQNEYLLRHTEFSLFFDVKLWMSFAVDHC